MIVVTGGAGFIGSVLIKELNLAGHTDILIIDRLRSGDKWKNLRGLKYQGFLHADDISKMDLADVFGDNLRTKYIFHLGACSATTEKNVDYLMTNNVEFSKILFMYAREEHIPVIYASSAATYGDGTQGYCDDHKKISKLMPLNPYGYSKQLVDEWVLNFVEKDKKNKTPWFGLKFFNVFGPNEYHKGDMRSVVYKAFEQIKNTGKVRLFKSHHSDYQDGGQKRDFIYVRDVVKAMLAMMNQTNPKHFGIYNLGRGESCTFNDLVTAVFKAMERPVNIEYFDMPEEIRNQYQYYTKADMKKLSTMLPDFKFSPVVDGVHDYVVNYLMNNKLYY